MSTAETDSAWMRGYRLGYENGAARLAEVEAERDSVAVELARLASAVGAVLTDAESDPCPWCLHLERVRAALAGGTSDG